MPRTSNILVSGSIAYDYVMSFPDYFSKHIIADKIHKLNVSFSINSLSQSYGGTAANISYNLSLLAQESSLLAFLGRDNEKYIKHLKTNKIKSDYLEIDNNAYTASAYITTDKQDNQITAFYPGPDTKNINEKKINALKDIDLAIISAELKLRMINYALYYQKRKIKYIFDPGQQITSFKKKELIIMIQGAKIVIGNDYEIEMIMKILKISLSDLKAKVPVLIITKASKGSSIFTDKKEYKIKAVKVKKIIDPTGAGDAYRAGLIKGLLLNSSWQKAGQLASLVASYPVSHLGTQEHKFNWTEIKKRYKVEFNDSLI